MSELFYGKSHENFYRNLTDFIFVEQEPLPADIIFVPGNGYPQMAEQAAQLYLKGYAPYILPSGKYAKGLTCFAGVQAKAQVYAGEYQTEWGFLAAVLEKKGVPKDAILQEDQATFTYENALLSRQVLDQMGKQIRRAIVCCNTTHARRCKMYYELVFPEAEILICPVAAEGVNKYNWFLSEKGIEAVLSEVDRCGRQFEQILLELKEQA